VGIAGIRRLVEGLLAGARPGLMITDPPYGVEYDAGWRKEALDPEAEYRLGAVTGDERSDWRQAWALFPGDVAYVWHGSLHAASVARSLEAVGFELRSQIVWVKPRIVISRGHYHWQHEVCWYAVRAGATAGWIGDKRQSTVWEMGGDESVEGGHSTQKPVEAMARGMRNHKGDVFDPFLGSGTTLVAAENEGRRCWGVEVERGYVGVILQRYLDAFGIRGRVVEE
jgi:DNA modification methylase